MCVRLTSEKPSRGKEVQSASIQQKWSVSKSIDTPLPIALLSREHAPPPHKPSSPPVYMSTASTHLLYLKYMNEQPMALLTYTYN